MNTAQPYKPVIVVPTYKRRDSLTRLLGTINNAHFPSDGVKLIISIDGDCDQGVTEAAEAFDFRGGSVEIVSREEHIGLREHIIWCGDLSQQYGSVIVLEDDLIVDPYFYNYATAALHHYDYEQKIAGIALYSQRYNAHAELPFEPLQTEDSTYFMQVGCSSGQAWSAGQWLGFREWYSKSDEKDVLNCDGLPDSVKRWPETSWKKYFNAYLVSRRKYFVYPYLSYSTNCSDNPGEHVKGSSNRFQVPMPLADRVGKPFNFASFERFTVAYDAYMEPCGTHFFKTLGKNKDEVTVDLHGQKPAGIILSKAYLLTCRRLNSGAVETFPIRFHPVELNIAYPSAKVDEIYLKLYKIEKGSEPVSMSNLDYFALARYYSYYDLGRNKYILGFFKQYVNNLVNRIKKIFS